MSAATQRVGVIGLGNIGGAIAANLIVDGHEVHVHDLDPTRVETLVAAGATAAASAIALAQRTEVVFTSLPNPAAMDTVATAWLAGATRDAVLVDLSTNAPVTVRAVGARISAAGCHLLEAPLTGGAPGAKMRMLVFMVGGDAGVYERCRPLLDKLGRASFHIGPLGSGNVAKLVNSLLAFTAAWVSLEGLAVAAKAGIDLRTMIEVIRTGGAGNFFTDRMVEGINERNRPTSFSLALAAKDAGLLLDVGRDLGVPTPVAAEVAQSFVAAIAAGLGERDFTDLVELMERHAGVKLHLPPPRSAGGSP
ncbi:MAG: NAD(P)-dependent oxidoreductase [Deltaproteobacteria bacterium]|nr:NAD(P)-dependent oxidoreductase [Deltaproteobacteria bacterium]MBI3389491.1 NAD(P)-dependent oxidoreductase [Deltaproteobacteria bacterium]